MKIMSLTAAAVLSITSLAGFATAQAAPAPAAHAHHVVVDKRHVCTKTSTGHCIRGGEFCPQASYGKSGWDAAGRRYVCKGDHVHPHWMKP